MDSSGRITLANKSGNIVAQYDGSELYLHGFRVNFDRISWWNFTSKSGEKINWSVPPSSDYFAEPENDYGVLVYASRWKYPADYSAEQPLGDEYSYYKAFAFSLETGQIIGNFGVDSNGEVRLDRVTSPGDTSFLVSGLWGATSDITTGD